MVPILPSTFHRKHPSFRVSSIAPEHLDVSAIWYVLELTFVRKLFREFHFLLLYYRLVMVGYRGIRYTIRWVGTLTPIRVQKKPGRVHCQNTGFPEHVWTRLIKHKRVPKILCEFLERVYVYVRRVQTRSGKPVF